MSQPGGSANGSTQETVRGTVQRLRRHQKPNRGAPAYSRFVNRPLGRVIAAVAYRLGMTPNQVTAISGFLSLCGILVAALLTPTVAAGVLVAVLLAAGYAFDSADGQLARLRGGGSPAGEWLDHIVDCAKITTLHLGVLAGLHRVGTAPDIGVDAGAVGVALPLAYLLVANLFFFSFILTDQLKRQLAPAGPSTATGGVPEPASVLRSLLVVPTDYGLLCVAFLLWGWTVPFLVVYALLLLGTAGYLALGLPKWYRDISDAAPARG